MPSSPESLQEGVVVWFRPEHSMGVVRLRSGRQYRFSQLSGLDLVLPRQIVQVSVGEGNPAPVVLHPMRGTEPVFEPEPLPPPKVKRVRKAPAKKLGSAAQAPKKKKSGTAPALRPKRDGSLPPDMTVLHPTFGQGFVVVSSPKVARVRFMPSEEERSVRVEDLKLLDTK